METVTVLQSAPDLAADFSLLSLFLRADIVVKLVMVGLLLASVVCWAIMFEKIILLRRVRRAADSFDADFWSGESLQSLYRTIGSGPKHPMANVFLNAMREWLRQDGGRNGAASANLLPAIERSLQSTIAQEIEQLEGRLPILATVGAVAPFVGLFGTVWGIMNSFQAIAVTRDTNLAVVAPGIAEALFATGLGLLAAIPAVIAYNLFAGQINRFGSRLDYFADNFFNIVAAQTNANAAGNASASGKTSRRSA